MEKLQITFQKQWLDKSDSKGSSEECSRVFLFGHYDALKIDIIESWHDFRPTGSNNGEKDLFADEYVVRMVCPLDDVKESTNNDIVKRLEDGIDRVKSLALLLNDASGHGAGYRYKPVVGVCLIKLTDNYISQFSDFHSLAKDALQIVYEESELAADLYCAAYFGMGYGTDVVLIYSSDGYCEIVKHINLLRKTAKDGCCFADSTYSVLGALSCNNVNTVYVEKCKNENVEAVIDFSLRKNGHLESEDQENIYTLLGSKDLRQIIGKKDLSEFLKLYADDGRFGFRSDTFTDVSTRISCEYNADDSASKIIDVVSEAACCGETSSQDSSDKAGINDIVKTAFDKFSSIYRGLIQNKFAHQRILGAVGKIKKIYDKVSLSVCGAAAYKIVGKFFADYLNAVSRLIEKMEKNDGVDDAVIYDGAGKEYDCRTYIDFIENSIEELRTSAEALLFDFQRSIHADFEGQANNRPNIGSAAKLLLMYNYIIDQWEEKLREEKLKETRESNNNFTYLVTSGGIDGTMNIDMFDGNDCLETRPIIVKISEGSLYDVDGTLLSLAHEFAHKRGKRCRAFRAANYYNLLCGFFARNCTDWIVLEFIKAHLRRVWNYNCNILRKAEVEKNKQEWGQEEWINRVYDIKMDKNWHHRFNMGYKIDDEIDKMIDSRMESIEKECKNIVSRFNYIRKEAEKSIISVLGHTNLQEGDDEVDVYNKLFEVYKLCFDDDEEQFKKMLYGDRVHRMCFEMMWRRIKYFAGGKDKQNIDLCPNDDLCMIVSSAVSRLCENFAEETSGGYYKNAFSEFNIVKLSDPMRKSLQDIFQNIFNLLFDGESSDRDYWDKFLGFYKGIGFLYPDIVRDDYKDSVSNGNRLAREVLPCVYKEGFADCIAINVMGIDSLNKYFLHFFFEQRDIDRYLYKRAGEYDQFKLAVFLRVAAVCEAFGFEIANNESAENDAKNFAKEILFVNNKGGDTRIEKFAKDYKTACADLKSIYDEYKSLDCFKESVKYFKRCIEMNKEACDRMRSCVGKLAEKSETSLSRRYALFIFEQWMKLISSENHAESEGNRA